jgi:hypothetical protein
MVDFPMHSLPVPLLSLGFQANLGTFQQLAWNWRTILLALQADFLGRLERVAGHEQRRPAAFSTANYDRRLHRRLSGGRRVVRLHAYRYKEACESARAHFSPGVRSSNCPVVLF